MYPKKEGIFDHAPLTNESTPETLTDKPSKSTNRISWIIGLGLVIVSCAAGYYILKYSFYNIQKKKKSNSTNMDCLT